MRIHPTAHVDPAARLGDVAVGPFSIVHGAVEIGDGAQIDAYCEIGHPAADGEVEPLRIGPGARVRSHSVLYQGSTFGPGLVTGHHVVVRERTQVGRNAQIGSNADIQGDCRIGDFFRSQSNIFVPKQSWIGDCVWLFPSATLTNDPHPPSELNLGVRLEDFAVICAAAVILPGVVVGARAVVAAKSLVTRDVPPDMLAAGNPARIVGPAADVRLRDGTGRPAYPWPTHFRRGYPDGALPD